MTDYNETYTVTHCTPKAEELLRLYVDEYMKVRVLNSGKVQVAASDDLDWRDL